MLPDSKSLQPHKIERIDSLHEQGDAVKSTLAYMFKSSHSNFWRVGNHNDHSILICFPSRLSSLSFIKLVWHIGMPSPNYLYGGQA